MKNILNLTSGPENSRLFWRYLCRSILEIMSSIDHFLNLLSWTSALYPQMIHQSLQGLVETPHRLSTSTRQATIFFPRQIEVGNPFFPLVESLKSHIVSSFVQLSFFQALCNNHQPHQWYEKSDY